VKEYFYIPTPEGLSAMLVKTNGNAGSMYYLHHDHLGSVVAISNSSGTLAEERSYDPWGRLRNPQNWSFTGVPALTLTLRSYTMHEYLPEFELINMNGRVYDPYTALFLSPDPYIQTLDFTQNYNRYAYVLNNPLRYTDPSGESILGVGMDFFIGFVKGFFKSIGTGRTMIGNAFHRGWHEAINGGKIDAGLFAWDQAYSGKGDVWRDLWQVISIFTWELPQTIVGYTSSHFVNNFGKVNQVDFFAGATVLQTKGEWGAITLGSYIIGDRDIDAQIGNPLIMHEYGHYIQSRKSGWIYFSKYGMPSILSPNDKPHKLHWTETDANLRSFEYLSRYYGVTRFDFSIGARSSDWQEGRYPLAINKVNPKLWEYTILDVGGGYVLGSIFIGLINRKHPK